MGKIERTFEARWFGIVRIEAENEEEFRQKVEDLRKATLDY
jgi:hypothetical protein